MCNLIFLSCDIDQNSIACKIFLPETMKAHANHRMDYEHVLDHAMKSSGLGSSGELIVLFGKITRWVPGAMWVEDRKT